VTEIGINMDMEVFAAVVSYTGLSLPAQRTEELLPAAIDTLTLIMGIGENENATV